MEKTWLVSPTHKGRAGELRAGGGVEGEFWLPSPYIQKFRRAETTVCSGCRKP